MLSRPCRLLLAVSACLAATLDITDQAGLQAAAQKTISNLFSMYEPSPDGVFEQKSTPWFASGILYDMVYDYSRWTGDEQFNDLVTAALANVSFGNTADILNGASNAFESLSGKWNDDIGHMSAAIMSGAELYGVNNEMPGINAPWITVPEKTLWEMAEQLDNGCGGGIYWSRNRLDDSRKNWKSAITNWCYTDVSARIFFQTKNQTVVDLSDQVFNWLQSSGLATQDGTLGDGMNVGVCKASEAQWTYNYGFALSTAAWHYKITQDSKWLTFGSAVLKKALATFASNNVVTELCEPTVQCNRDQQHFKGILLRKMAYYYRITNNQADKESIKAAVSGSFDNMVPFCNDQWVCPGNWTDSPQRVAHLYPADLGAASSLLVSALGIYHQMTGPDLIPSSQLSSSGNSGNGGNGGKGGHSSSGALTLSASISNIIALLTLVSGVFWAL